MDFITAVAVGISLGQLEEDIEEIINDPEATKTIKERAKRTKENLAAVETMMLGGA